MPSPILTLPTQILHTLQEPGEIQLHALSIPWSLQLEMIVASSSLSYDLNSDSCVAALAALLDYKLFCSYHILLIFVIFYRT